MCLIAVGISPFQPDVAAFRAGRLMLREIVHHAAQGVSFAFETTLSGLTYARMIDDWRSDGYTVKMIFLALGSAEEAIARVATRVAQGGHDVPEATIRRRFDAGRLNFQSIYRPRVNSWLLFDNSGEIPLFLSEGENT